MEENLKNNHEDAFSALARNILFLRILTVLTLCGPPQSAPSGSGSGRVTMSPTFPPDDKSLLTIIINLLF